MKQRHSFEERDSINAWFKLPKYRIWKYLIIGDAITLILLILATIIWMDSLAWQTVMVLRGCAGVLGVFSLSLLPFITTWSIRTTSPIVLTQGERVIEISNRLTLKGI